MQHLLAWLVTAAALAAQEPAQDVFRVRLEASAPGKGAEGRVAAVQKAQKDAVLQVVKSFTASDDPLLFRPLLDNAATYVRSYQIIEQKQNGDTTEIKLDAFINDKRLKRDLASVVLPLFPKPPRVVIVVAESESAVTDPPLEEQLAEAFEDAGMEVVDPKKACAGLDENELQQRVKGEAGTAARFAWENLAEVAVIGEATVATDENKGSNLHPRRATLVLRIIRGDDARTFDVHTAEAVVNSADPAEGYAMALSDACEKIKEPVLVSSVLAAAGAKGTPYIVVTVEGLQTADQARQLCERAKQDLGADEAEPLYVGGGAGRIRLKYDGPMGPLVDALTEAPYSGFSLVPRQVVEHDVTLAVED